MHGLAHFVSACSNSNQLEMTQCACGRPTATNTNLSFDTARKAQLTQTCIKVDIDMKDKAGCPVLDAHGHWARLRLRWRQA